MKKCNSVWVEFKTVDEQPTVKASVFKLPQGLTWGQRHKWAQSLGATNGHHAYSIVVGTKLKDARVVQRGTVTGGRIKDKD